MKTLTFMFAFLIGAATAQAADCNFVCNQMSNNSYRQCKQMLSDGFFQKSACEVCAFPAADHTTLNCVSAIKNKTYSHSEIRECSQISSDYGVLSCMERNGRFGGNDPYPSPRCDLSRLNRQIDGAISNYYGNNFPAVLNTLNNMKSELRSCQY